MSEWITDRLPTEDDADDVGCVWHDCKGKVYRLSYTAVKKGEPWHSIAWPEPYPRSVRWAVKWYEDYAIWCLLDQDVVVLVLDKNLATEAAQRIADLYNEVMP
jgi:hypothetical protein